MTILGRVDIRDWDIGCYLSLGAELITYQIDGDSRAQYVVDIPNILNDIERFQGKIPVFFDTPEDPYQNYILPSFVFKQNDYTPAFDRQPLAGVVARVPSPDADPVHGKDGKILGYTKYVSQLRADPYDITYDLQVLARRKDELMWMVQHVMKRMRPPWFSFKIIDSLGDVRNYDAGDMTFSNTSELADIADRTASWAISFTVRGEIDTFDDVGSVAMIDPRVRMHVKEI